jgi:hypothetical protein
MKVGVSCTIQNQNARVQLGWAGVTVTYLRLYVTDSNDAILNEVGRTTVASLVGRFMNQEVRRDTALGQILVVPLGNASFGVWISMTAGLAAKFP